MSMSSTPPTRREVCLVALLFIALLSLSRNGFKFIPNASSSSTLQPTPDPTLAEASGLLQESIPRRMKSIPSWPRGKLPHTQIVAHVPGWTIIDNLYLHNGTLFIVSDTPTKIPDRLYMISTGQNIKNGAEEVASRIPTDKEMRIISTRTALQMFGNDVDVFDGVTWLANDSPQFVQHYFHWSAELFFGFWRTYSSLDPSITSNGSTALPPPRRMIFAHADAEHWRDYASMNELVMRIVFPSITMEYQDDWRDRAELGRPFVFDRVVLADRSAAMYGFNYIQTQRTASQPFALPGSAYWWSTARNSIVDFMGVSLVTAPTPVITYVSRQEWGRRMLLPEDHDNLVRELYNLRDRYGYEVNVVSMDKLSRIDQISLAARTTIMMGVHGNGMTALVWMKPSPRSTVMEFFFPGGFAHDYEYTTRALGMVHYGFWGNSAFTSPQTPKPQYVEGFQGNSIPLDGALVARLCHARLSLADEADD